MWDGGEWYGEVEELCLTLCDGESDCSGGDIGRCSQRHHSAEHSWFFVIGEEGLGDGVGGVCGGSGDL